MGARLDALGALVKDDQVAPGRQDATLAARAPTDDPFTLRLDFIPMERGQDGA